MGKSIVYVNVDRAEAIKIGNNSFGALPVYVDLSELTGEQRETLSWFSSVYYLDQSVRESAIAHVNASTNYDWLPAIGEATVDNLKKQLDYYRSERDKEIEKKKAQHEKEVAEWIALPDENKIRKIYSSYQVNYSTHTPTNDPRIVAEAQRLRPLIDQKNAELKQQEEEQARIKKEREEFEEKRAIENQKILAEKIAAKKQQLTEAINRVGTEVQQERWNDGVMPMREAYDLFYADALASLGMPYHSSKSFVIGCDCDSEECEETEKRTLTDEQYLVVKEVKKALPEFNLSYWHQKCNSCDDQCDVVRVNKMIGEIEVEADIIL